MLRVVIDTNVVVSALNFGGLPDEVLSLVRREEIQLFISPFILHEIEEVLKRKFRWSQEMAGVAVRNIRDKSTVVDPKEKISVIKARDSDNRILECAVEGGAQCIVSGDKQHLLPLKKYKGIRILSPAEFMEMYGR